MLYFVFSPLRECIVRIESISTPKQTTLDPQTPRTITKSTQGSVETIEKTFENDIQNNEPTDIKSPCANTANDQNVDETINNDVDNSKEKEETMEHADIIEDQEEGPIKLGQIS